jgi:hypothetical protein
MCPQHGGSKTLIQNVGVHAETVPREDLYGPRGPRNSPAPLAHAFASTFIWALVLILVALIPALGMALSGWKRPLVAPAGERVLALE